MSHLSAAVLLDRVRHSEDPAAERVLTLVGRGRIAEVWSDADDSLPAGVLARLYMLRTWMRSNLTRSRDPGVCEPVAYHRPFDAGGSGLP